MNQISSSPQKDLLIRGLYIVMYFVIFYILWFIIIALAILQFLSNLFFRNSNKNLENLGQSISLYVQDIIRFVSFNTDKKPYPFDNWPSSKR